MRQVFIRIAAMTALLALSPVPAALAQSAGTTTSTANVAAGTLSVGTVGSLTFTGTLTGLNQVFTTSNSIPVTDASGSGNGWNLTIAGSAFSSGGASPRTLSSTALQLTGVTAAAATDSTATMPSNSISGTLTVPLGSSATAAKFYNAAANSGMGSFTLTPSYSLTIPASTFAANYSSTLTVSLVSGP